MLGFLRISALAGLIVFVPVLLAAAVAPQYVERAARDFAVGEVRKEIDLRRDTPAGQALQAARARLAETFAKRKQAAQEQLASGFAERVSEILARLCRLDCAARQRLKTALEDGLKDRIAGLDSSLATLEALAQEKFDEVTSKIRRDLVIFSGSNSAVFAVLLALSLLRREHARPLLLPASLMLVSTVASALIYLFGQNWFFTILTDSYVGYGYLGYVAVIFFFLWDIVMNGAEITTGLVRSLAEALSACSPV